MLIEYRLRIRNAANDADALVVTSQRGGTNPYISKAPTGDGASLDPLTGKVIAGVFAGRIVDPITSGTSRLFTSQLEDADFRQQLGHRRAYWEINVDSAGFTTLAAGRLTRAALVSDIEWEIAIGDWMEAEHQTMVFGRKSTDSLEDYLTRWPNRGCIIGGPVLNGFGQIRSDLGGWLMGCGRSSSPDRTTFTFVRGYGPDSKFQIRESLNTTADNPNGLWKRVNEACAGFYRHGVGSGDLGADTADPGYGTFPELVVLINRNAALSDGAVAIAGIEFNILRLQDPSSTRSSGITVAGHFGVDGVNNLVDVITADVSDLSPIYWVGHPVDLISALNDEAGLPYDSASLEAVRDEIGATALLSIKVTKAQELGKYLEDTAYGPFGIGARMSSTGVLYYFVSRIFSNNVASLTVIEDEDVEQGSTRPFNLDAKRAIKTVALEHKRYFGTWHDRFDGVGESDERIERGNADPASIGTGEATFSIDGMLHFARTNGVELRTAAGWVDARAHEIFDRWGRGGIGARTTLLRGQSGDGVVLGQELLIALPQVPNHNKRLGDDATVSGRAMQIVHLTPTAKGYEVELEDSGPNAQPVSTIPTNTIAKDGDNPRNVAAVTITNAATLNALPAGLQLQWAVVASSGTPAAEDYTDVAFYEPGEIPTAAIRLPAVYADSKVSVRARSTQPDRRPSNWSTVATVTIDALSAPSTLAATPTAGDGSYLDIAFTIGTDSEAAYTDVFVRKSSESASANKLITALLPGSVSYRIYGLIPSTEYVVTIRHRDDGNNDVSASITDTETTGSTTVTLTAPSTADGFSLPFGPPARAQRRGLTGLGPLGQARSARYGLGVMASVIPGFIEIAEAVETSVGSGSYGAYATVDTIESVAGDWSVWSSSAPNDGLRRKLKARHVRVGTTASSYTTEVVLTPGSLDPLSLDEVPQGTLPIDSSGNATLQADLPSWATSAKYATSTSAFPTDATVLSSGTTVNGRQIDTAISSGLAVGASLYVTLIPFSGASATGLQGASIRLKATRHDFSAQKTVLFNAMAFTVTDNSLLGNVSHFVAIVDGYIRIMNHDEGSSVAFLDLYDNYQVPQGVTITEVNCEVYCDEDTFARASFEFYRVDSEGADTLLADGTTDADGWSTLTDTMSESTTGRRYKMRVMLDSTVGSPLDTDARCAGWSITFTMPSSVNAL